MDQPRSPADWNWISQNLLAHRPLAVFCGAGISRQAGLPIVADLVSAILHLLHASPEVHRRVGEIPFEAFVEVLSQNSNVEPLLGMFAGGSPGTNHRLLAELVRRGEVADLCTTNFDLLIERACSAAGIEPGGRLDVLHSADRLRDEPWSRAHPRLVKIHGCASRQREMAVTIAQVAGRVHSAPRAAAIEHVFAGGGHGAVLVLGYSCSDAFDLSPQIELLAERGKPVFVVEHSSEAGGAIRVEPLGVKLAKNPFREYPRGFRIFADTDLLVAFLWRELVPDRDYPAPEVRDTPWREAVETWGRQLSPFAPSLIRGSLMQMLGMLDECLAEFEALAALGSRVGIPAMVAAGLGNQVAPLLRKGDPERAAEVGRRAVAVFREERMLPELGNELGWVGNCMLQLGRPEEALPYYHEAREILHGAGDPRGAGNQQGNIANALYELRRYEEAVREYEGALEVADRLGNVQGVVNQLIGLSRSMLALGRPADALPHSRRGESIVAAFGGLQEPEHLVSLSADAYHRLGLFREAAQSYEHAVALAREEGNEAHARMYLKDMASVLLKLGEWERAVLCASEADPDGRAAGAGGGDPVSRFFIALAETKSGRIDSAQATLQALLDDPTFALAPVQRVSLLSHLANIYINRASPAAAMPLLRDALELCEAHHLDLIGSVRSTLGQASLATEGPGSARVHMEAALSLARDQGDLPQQAHCHELLATLHAQLGDPRQAAEHALAALEIAESTGDRELVVWALADLGGIRMMQGSPGPALECFSRGLELSQAMDLPTGIAVHRRYRAQVFGLVGMEEDAIVELAEARRLYVATFGPEDPDLPGIDSEVGRLREVLGKHRRRSLLQAWHDEPVHLPDPQVLSSGSAFYAHRLESAPEDPDVMFYCGRFLYRLKRSAEAIDALRSCRAEGARRTEAMNYLGNLYYDAGRPHEALEAFAIVLSREPDHQNAHFVSALCSNDLGRTEASAHHYAQVGPEHPCHAETLFNRGLCAFAMEDLDAARGYFEDFLALQNDDVDAWMMLAVARAALGELDEAQAALEKAAAAGADEQRVNELADAIAAARHEAGDPAKREGMGPG